MCECVRVCVCVCVCVCACVCVCVCMYVDCLSCMLKNLYLSKSIDDGSMGNQASCGRERIGDGSEGHAWSHPVGMHRQGALPVRPLEFVFVHRGLDSENRVTR